MRRSRRSLAAAIVGAAFVLPGWPAAARPDPAPAEAPAADDSAPNLPAIVRRLDAPALDDRDAAQVQLAEGRDISLGHIRELLRDKGLSAEQRLRLVAAFTRRFTITSRGAVGINYASIPGPDGISISATVRGFPAAENGTFRVGDVLTELDGVPLARAANADPADLMDPTTRLPSVIMSHDPGEVVKGRVLRRFGPNGELPPVIQPGEADALIMNQGAVRIGGEQPAPALDEKIPPEQWTTRVVEVDIPLGRFDDLRSRGMVSTDVVGLALQRRLAREGLTRESWAPLPVELTGPRGWDAVPMAPGVGLNRSGVVAGPVAVGENLDGVRDPWRDPALERQWRAMPNRLGGNAAQRQALNNRLGQIIWPGQVAATRPTPTDAQSTAPALPGSTESALRRLAAIEAEAAEVQRAADAAGTDLARRQIAELRLAELRAERARLAALLKGAPVAPPTSAAVPD
ncbi:MAG: PDZ domain-containing protein [Phycisphaerales bacterium]|nr:PDZ domain-containing protein [Phycisphaerales bacterium]